MPNSANYFLLGVFVTVCKASLIGELLNAHKNVHERVQEVASVVTGGLANINLNVESHIGLNNQNGYAQNHNNYKPQNNQPNDPQIVVVVEEHHVQDKTPGGYGGHNQGYGGQSQGNGGHGVNNQAYGGTYGYGGSHGGGYFEFSGSHHGYVNSGYNQQGDRPQSPHDHHSHNQYQGKPGYGNNPNFYNKPGYNFEKPHCVHDNKPENFNHDSDIPNLNDNQPFINKPQKEFNNNHDNKPVFTGDKDLSTQNIPSQSQTNKYPNSDSGNNTPNRETNLNGHEKGTTKKPDEDAPLFVSLGDFIDENKLNGTKRETQTQKPATDDQDFPIDIRFKDE